MKAPLPQAFFDRPVLTVAEGLLGKVLVRKKKEKGSVRGIITEVEAYDGQEDKASHAHRGRTKRNAPMFGPAGHWYVYLVYGMYWMLNIVTGSVGYPAAVLIRGVSEFSTEGAKNSLSPRERARVRGPGILTRTLHIDKTFNAQPARGATGLWIEDHGIRVPLSAIRRTPRIGVDYAGVVWAKKPYRLFLSRDYETLQPRFHAERPHPIALYL